MIGVLQKLKRLTVLIYNFIKMTLIDKIQEAVKSIQDKKYMPVFRYGDITEVDDINLTMNRIMEQQHKKFPLIYMSSDYDETEIINDKIFETDLTLWIVGKSKENYTAKQRHERELPALRTIRQNIERAIEIKAGQSETISKKEIFFKKDINEFDTPVNVIRMIFSGLKYQLIECT